MKLPKTLLGIACYFIASLAANGEPKTVTDYFLAIPAQPFTEGTPAELVAIMKRPQGDSLIDTKNGYMRLEGDGAQVSLGIALFRHDDKSPLLAVAWGDLEEPDFTHVTLFKEKDGKMVVADRKILPPGDSPDLRFELPRHGRTVIVRNAGGDVVSKWTWNGGKFVRE